MVQAVSFGQVLGQKFGSEALDKIGAAGQAAYDVANDVGSSIMEYAEDEFGIDLTSTLTELAEQKFGSGALDKIGAAGQIAYDFVNKVGSSVVEFFKNKFGA